MDIQNSVTGKKYKTDDEYYNKLNIARSGLKDKTNNLTLENNKIALPWIEYPESDIKLDEFLQFLSARLLVIEKEKYKLELERQEILQTLWGYNNKIIPKISSNITNNKKTECNMLICDKSELQPFAHRKQHIYNNCQSLNEILDLNSPKKDIINETDYFFNKIDFGKLDLEVINVILAHFGIKQVCKTNFNEGVDMLNRIRNYLMYNKDNEVFDVDDNNLSDQ